MVAKLFRVGFLTTAVLITGTALIEKDGDRRLGKSAAAVEHDTVTLGRSYSRLLAKTYAEGWVAAADALEAGQSVEEARTVLQDTWKKARTRAFREHLQPAFSKVLTEGTEPVDAAQRRRVASFWKDFAAGLREAR